MASAARKLDELVAARYLRLGSTPSAQPREQWIYPVVSGRLVEIRAAAASARLTAAMGIVRDAQRRGETAAWVTTSKSCFFPPDASDGGIDLDALVVIRLDEIEDIPVAADNLVRSGGFGLVVMDGEDVPHPMQSRLAGLARKHAAAVLMLSEKAEKGGSAGPMVSLRCQAIRLKKKEKVSLEIIVDRDRSNPSGWTCAEPCRAPAGLR